MQAPNSRVSTLLGHRKALLQAWSVCFSGNFSSQLPLLPNQPAGTPGRAAWWQSCPPSSSVTETQCMAPSGCSQRQAPNASQHPRMGRYHLAGPWTAEEGPREASREHCLAFCFPSLLYCAMQGLESRASCMGGVLHLNYTPALSF